MSNVDWRSFFRNVLGNRGSEMEDSFTIAGWGLEEENASTEEEQDDYQIAGSWAQNYRDHLVDLTLSDDDELVPGADLENTSQQIDDENDGRQIYVGNLHRDCSAATLKSFLSAIDDTSTSGDDFAVVKINPPRFGVAVTYAFVNCPTVRCAHSLIRKSRERSLMFCGRRLRIQLRYTSSIRRERQRQLLQELHQHQQQRVDEPEEVRGAAAIDVDDSSDDTDRFFQSMMSDDFDMRYLIHSTSFLAETQETGNRSSVTGANRTSIYCEMRQDAHRQIEKLESELSEKLKAADLKFRALERSRRLKEAHRARLQDQMEKLQSEMAKLESETAGLDADRNIVEDSLRQFVEEHEVKIKAVKDRIQKFRIEREASKASTSITTTINEDEANANSVRPSQPDFGAVSARVLDELDCICCYDKMTVPIFQCSHGHLICCRCHRRLKSCPVCRETYTRPIRSRLAEAMVEMLITEETTSS